MSRIDRIAEPWGTRTPYGAGRDVAGAGRHATSPTGVTEDDVDRWVQSASILHSNGDALDIAVKDGRIVGVRGRADRPRQPRPARARRTCSAGRPTTRRTG